MLFAFFITGTLIGQALVGTMVAVVGYILKRHQNQIHVLVNNRMTQALARIAVLETALGLAPGQPVGSQGADEG